jgi:hypothetical protein
MQFTANALAKVTAYRLCVVHRAHVVAAGGTSRSQALLTREQGRRQSDADSALAVEV